MWQLCGRCTIFGLRFRQKDSFRLGPFYHNARWKRGWVGPRAGLDGVINCLQRELSFINGTHCLFCISLDNFGHIRDIFQLYDVGITIKWVAVTTAWRIHRLRMEERPPVWKVAANILNNQSWKAEKRWSSSLGCWASC